MLRSMTGYGRAERQEALYVKVEIKSVNQRFSDIYIRLPRHLNFLEDDIKKLIKDKISRGKLEVYISVEYIDKTINNIKIDWEMAKNFKESLDKLREILEIEEPVKIEDILSLKDIVDVQKDDTGEEETAHLVLSVVDDAVEELLKMKTAEGKVLGKAIDQSLVNIESMLKEIEDLSKNAPLTYKEKLHSRIEDLLKDESVAIDEDKMIQEIAFISDKSDVTEEIVRLHSHIKQFNTILSKEDIVGRKLDFLVQEMNREINTIGSKSFCVEISKLVVEVKTEIEKIREQIQNLE
ncbi:MAG: YicC family protein [Tissierellia bacterium]|nr:YicC family protein [Tissierellia bacterium]